MRPPARAKRAGDALGFAAHRLWGHALGVDAGRLAVALGTLEGLVAGQQWDAIEHALRAVDRATDEVVDALS